LRPRFSDLRNGRLVRPGGGEVTATVVPFALGKKGGGGGRGGGESARPAERMGERALMVIADRREGKNLCVEEKKGKRRELPLGR